MRKKRIHVQSHPALAMECGEVRVSAGCTVDIHE
jgi:hypothetical protein